MKNILFDLGNVILDIDFNRTIKAFQDMGQADFYVDLDQTDPIFYNFEVGRISPSDFIHYWSERLPGVSDEVIIAAWNALLVEIKPEVFTILNRLKNNFDLFIYSNTNAIHIDWVKKYLKSEFGMEDWEPQLFKAAYYSHELGQRKPDDQGFFRILAEQKLRAEETLFIDDHLPNIQTAMKLGFQSIHKKAKTPLSQIIEINRLL